MYSYSILQCPLYVIYPISNYYIKETQTKLCYTKPIAEEKKKESDQLVLFEKKKYHIQLNECKSLTCQ